MQIYSVYTVKSLLKSKFLCYILCIQFAMLGAIGLDIIDLRIAILRPLIGLIYLIILPGYLTLRAINLGKINVIETILYAIGLGITDLMFIGYMMNTIYPLLGIHKPISLVPLILSINIFELTLWFFCYLMKRDFSGLNSIKLREIIFQKEIVLFIIPVISIFGSYLVNVYNNNYMLLFLFIVISLIILMIGFNKVVSENSYSLLIFFVALSLLFHRSLISNYIWGWDSHYEYYFSSLVLKESFWDSSVPSCSNAMLSVVMIAPIISIICNLDLNWIFKIVYPSLFAFVPLGLYQIYRMQTNKRISILSCLFFISLFTFYTEMLTLARQQIAELFLVLLILTIINKNIGKTQKSIVQILFGFSIITSHYGLSYLFIFILIASLLTSILIENNKINELIKDYTKFLNCYKLNSLKAVHILKTNHAISSNFVILITIFAITWYIYISSSSSLISIVDVGSHIAGSIFDDLLNPVAAEGLGIIMTESPSPLHSLAKYVHLLTQFFITIGMVLLVLNKTKMKFEIEYLLFSFFSYIICIFSIVIPHFGSSLNTTRIYHIGLILMAPFFVIGGIKAISQLNGLITKLGIRVLFRDPLCALSFLIVIYLLFNSGFIYEITGDGPASAALSQNWIKTQGTGIAKSNLYYGFDIEQDVISLNWISAKISKNDIVIYSGLEHIPLLISYSMLPEKSLPLLANTTTISKKSYIYLGYFNIIEGMIGAWSAGPKPKKTYYQLYEIRSYLDRLSKIYSNSGSEIYYEGSD